MYSIIGALGISPVETIGVIGPASGRYTAPITMYHSLMFVRMMAKKSRAEISESVKL
jgi:hypothetical protein